MKDRLAGISLILLALVGLGAAISPQSTQKVINELQSINKSK